MADDVVDESSTTVVDEWIVTGEPGAIRAGVPGLSHLRFPSYRFTYSSADCRWLGEKAELTARGFVRRCHELPAGMGQWESGPFLHHRTVTYSALEPVEV